MNQMHKQDRLDQPSAPSLLARPIRIGDIEEGKQGLIQASSAERGAIASMLDLVGLDRLEFIYRLSMRGGGRIGLSGTLDASATQTCVVSLEPVGATLKLPVDVEFWPPHLIEELENAASEPVSNAMLDWPEPIIDGKIDLGPVIYESLAMGLDPYPRAEGAEFGWPGEEASGGAEIAGAGPFAALERLKRR